MAAKIVLFLSELRSTAKTETYRCPTGEIVSGTQTNEAPVKYLLKRYPQTEEILCIVTKRAKDSAWDFFRESIQQEAAGVSLTAIPFEETQDFTKQPLSEILERLQPGDSVLLETTGGFRNAVMDLLLLSRILSYAGIQTECAVYSNYQKREIEDISHLIRLFDLVGGMQELASFGSIKTLKTYYRGSSDQKIQSLLYAMERLFESITLCRTQTIDDGMKRFDEALTAAEACDDPLMRQLLPAFRKKFGKKLSTPGIIKWCVDSGMLQQALTVYKERIPAYLLSEDARILSVKPNSPLPVMKNYQNEGEARFFEQFLKMGRNMRSTYYGKDPNYEFGVWKDATIPTLEHLDELLPNSYFVSKYPAEQLRVIAMDYLYLRALRNMTNHANDATTDYQHQLNAYLIEHNYKNLDEVNMDDIVEAIRRALEHLKPIGKKGKKH